MRNTVCVDVCQVYSTDRKLKNKDVFDQHNSRNVQMTQRQIQDFPPVSDLVILNW